MVLLLLERWNTVASFAMLRFWLEGCWGRRTKWKSVSNVLERGAWATLTLGIPGAKHNNIAYAQRKAPWWHRWKKYQYSNRIWKLKSVKMTITQQYCNLGFELWLLGLSTFYIFRTVVVLMRVRFQCIKLWPKQRERVAVRWQIFA